MLFYYAFGFDYLLSFSNCNLGLDWIQRRCCFYSLFLVSCIFTEYVRNTEKPMNIQITTKAKMYANK